MLLRPPQPRNTRPIDSTFSGCFRSPLQAKTITPVAGRREPWSRTAGTCSSGHGLAPVGDLHDGPDAVTLARPAKDAEVPAEPGDLARDPLGLGGVAEARVVRHRAEDVDVGRLRPEVDRQLLDARPVPLLVGPRVVEGAEERALPRGVADLPELADPVGEEVAPPANPRLPVGRQEQAGELGRSRPRAAPRPCPSGTGRGSASQKQVSGRLGTACSQLAWAWW